LRVRIAAPADMPKNLLNLPPPQLLLPLLILPPPPPLLLLLLLLLLLYNLEFNFVNVL